eukprot:s1645_g3.t1
MLQKGFLEEVATLLEKGLISLDTPAADAIGYRQVIEYLTRPEPQYGDAASLVEFVRKFGSVSRNYARSQMHWFMKDTAFVWVETDPRNPALTGVEVSRLCGLDEFDYASEAEVDGEVRQKQAEQASAMAWTFTSALEQGEVLTAQELSELLPRADNCTRRVPSAARQQPQKIRAIAVESKVPYGKVYWPGRHRKWGWGNPLGKLHRQGLQLFQSSGWQAIGESDDSVVPAFCWPTRQAGKFPATVSGGDILPLIRPFPQDFTMRLDNKAQLARHLQAAGCNVHPETWDAQDFLASPPSEKGLFFLKHSLGVKGTGVHLFDYSGLLQRLNELGNKGCRQFIVQRYVWPPALQNGRKWVLRAHALLHGKTDGTLRLYCHSDIIALEYGQPYTEQLDLRAAHISNVAKIKHLPKPTLVDDSELAHQVHRLTEQAFGAVLEHAPRGPFTPEESELCQVFGLDVILDAGGKAWLLEVNDYPAIASGTMEHVDTAVYTRLARDLLLLVVAPKLDGTDPAPGGWCELKLPEDRAQYLLPRVTWTRCSLS